MDGKSYHDTRSSSSDALMSVIEIMKKIFQPWRPLTEAKFRINFRISLALYRNKDSVSLSRVKEGCIKRLSNLFWKV